MSQKRLKKKLVSAHSSLPQNQQSKNSLGKYPTFVFHRTSVNYWKKKCKPQLHQTRRFNRAARPNLLDDNLLKKVKDIATGTRMTGVVINRRSLICIANGVVKANNPDLLKEFGGNLELTDGQEGS